MPVQTWECEECGYVVAGTKKPKRCPDCDTEGSFVLCLEEEDEEGFEDLEGEEEDKDLDGLYEDEEEGDEEDEDIL